MCVKVFWRLPQRRCRDSSSPATLKTKAPKGAEWLHEIKYDGYRVQIHVNSGKKRVFTRNGHDWVKRFSTVAGALDIPCQAVIDGEVVVIHEGRTNFSELQADIAAGRQDRLVYYAFDLLWLGGKDLRKTPQIARKQALRDLLDENGVEARIVYSEHLIGDGQERFEHAANLNWEGIVSKRADARTDRNAPRPFADCPRSALASLRRARSVGSSRLQREYHYASQARSSAPFGLGSCLDAIRHGWIVAKRSLGPGETT